MPQGIYYECSHKSQLKNWLRHLCGKKGADVREVVGAGSAGAVAAELGGKIGI